MEHNFFYDFTKVTGALPALAIVRPVIRYAGKKQHIRDGVLLMANHRSGIDPITVCCTFWYRRPRFIATKELFEKPVRRFFFSAMHCIRVDRDNFSMHTYRETCRQLKDGKMVCIFPEGEINRSEEAVKGFKKGAAVMAYESGVPLLPVYIRPREHWYESTHVMIGEPVNLHAQYPERPSLDEWERIAEKLQGLEQDLAKKTR